MSIPLFPDLTPRIIDPLWFSLDCPSNDENELLQLEHEHKNWLNRIAQKHLDIPPIGKTAVERAAEEEEEEDEDEDDSNEDEESETQDEEDEDMEVDISYDRVEPAPSTES